ncbi:MAG: hypothetical protein HY658_08730 [Actinobacteria bacterium]|nr:hypothetical protein [Actinomycetota bacterium]
MESVLENKVARAATMIANGADEFRSQLGKARGSIARARASGVDTPTLSPGGVPPSFPLPGGEAGAVGEPSLRAVD